MNSPSIARNRYHSTRHLTHGIVHCPRNMHLNGRKIIKGMLGTFECQTALIPDPRAATAMFSELIAVAFLLSLALGCFDANLFVVLLAPSLRNPKHSTVVTLGFKANL